MSLIPNSAGSVIKSAELEALCVGQNGVEEDEVEPRSSTNDRCPRLAAFPGPLPPIPPDVQDVGALAVRVQLAAQAAGVRVQRSRAA